MRRIKQQMPSQNRWPVRFGEGVRGIDKSLKYKVWSLFYA